MKFRNFDYWYYDTPGIIVRILFVVVFTIGIYFTNMLADLEKELAEVRLKNSARIAMMSPSVSVAENSNPSGLEKNRLTVDNRFIKCPTLCMRIRWPENFNYLYVPN